jgi:hypothetical protein
MDAPPPSALDNHDLHDLHRMAESKDTKTNLDGSVAGHANSLRVIAEDILGRLGLAEADEEEEWWGREPAILTDALVEEQKRKVRERAQDELSIATDGTSRFDIDPAECKRVLHSWGPDERLRIQERLKLQEERVAAARKQRESKQTLYRLTRANLELLSNLGNAPDPCAEDGHADPFEAMFS